MEGISFLKEFLYSWSDKEEEIYSDLMGMEFFISAAFGQNNTVPFVVLTLQVNRFRVNQKVVNIFEAHS